MNAGEKRKIKIDKQKRLIAELQKELKSNYSNNAEREEILKTKNKLNQATLRLQNLEYQLDINISDHALVRYIERTLGLDLNQVKESMKMYCKDNNHPLLHFEIKDNLVITVIEK